MSTLNLQRLTEKNMSHSNDVEKPASEDYVFIEGSFTTNSAQAVEGTKDSSPVYEQKPPTKNSIRPYLEKLILIEKEPIGKIEEMLLDLTHQNERQLEDSIKIQFINEELVKKNIYLLQQNESSQQNIAHLEGLLKTKDLEITRAQQNSEAVQKNILELQNQILAWVDINSRAQQDLAMKQNTIEEMQMIQKNSDATMASLNQEIEKLLFTQSQEKVEAERIHAIKESLRIALLSSQSECAELKENMRAVAEHEQKLVEQLQLTVDQKFEKDLQVKRLESEIEGFKEEINLAHTVLEHFQEQLETSKLDFDKQIALKTSMVAELEQEVLQNNQKILVLENALTQERENYQELQKVKEQFKITLQSLESKSQDYDLVTKSLAAKESELSLAHEMIQLKEAELVIFQQTCEESFCTSAQLKEDLKEVTQSKDLIIAQNQSHWEKIFLEAEAVQEKLKLQFINEKSQLAQEIQQLKIDIVELDQKNKMEKIETEKQRAKTETDISQMEAQILNREDQIKQRSVLLQNYAKFLNAEKAQLMSSMQDFAQEMNLANEANPLKDYLKLTEYQLSKIEVQLKKTPMLAPERIGLEYSLGQFVEQRTFLKSTLETSDKQIQTRCNYLLDIVRNGKLSPVPPIPPLSKIKT